MAGPFKASLQAAARATRRDRSEESPCAPIRRWQSHRVHTGRECAETMARASLGGDTRLIVWQHIAWWLARILCACVMCRFRRVPSGGGGARSLAAHALRPGNAIRSRRARSCPKSTTTCSLSARSLHSPSSKTTCVRACQHTTSAPHRRARRAPCAAAKSSVARGTAVRSIRHRIQRECRAPTDNHSATQRFRASHRLLSAAQSHVVVLWP